MRRASLLQEAIPQNPIPMINVTPISVTGEWDSRVARLSTPWIHFTANWISSWREPHEAKR
jgi:hypothetical protein